LLVHLGEALRKGPGHLIVAWIDDALSCVPEGVFEASGEPTRVRSRRCPHRGLADTSRAPLMAAVTRRCVRSLGILDVLVDEGDRRVA
jgi:hypothetical protein